VETLGLSAARDMEGASWGCIGRTMRRGVVKIGEGSGAFAVAWGEACASACADMVMGSAGVGWAAIVLEVQRAKCRSSLWWSLS
jgi:hypothetical protein